MTGGDDILYLITLRNLEIHLVIGLCCFEMCFGTGLLTGLQWYLLFVAFKHKQIFSATYMVFTKSGY